MVSRCIFVLFQVQLKSSPNYEFPPLLLCPVIWFDAEKAYRMGLSEEALKYSLSYVDRWFQHQFEDIEAAREEFHGFYKTRNYSSLMDYFEDISQELRPKAKSDGSGTWYECRACDRKMNEMAELTYLANRICYIFRMKPVEHGFGMHSGIRLVMIQLRDKTAGLLHDSLDWDLYFSPRLDLHIWTYPTLTIRSVRKNTVKLSIQKFKALNKSENPCHESAEGDESYSSVRCIAKCHNALYRKYWGCGLMWLSQSRLEMIPESACNYADRRPPENWTLEQFLESDVNERIDALAAEQCVKQCPLLCARTIYSTVLLEQQTLLDTAHAVVSAREANATVMQVMLQHGDVYQGGTLVSQEVYMYSFTQLVNNIGGALGVFVGATLMTLVQLILFCVTYAWT